MLSVRIIKNQDLIHDPQINIKQISDSSAIPPLNDFNRDTVSALLYSRTHPVFSQFHIAQPKYPFNKVVNFCGKAISGRFLHFKHLLIRWIMPILHRL